MLPLNARIVSAVEDNDLNESRQPIRVMRVQYVIGDDGPFVDRVPLTPNWTTIAHERIEQRARELADLRR